MKLMYSQYVVHGVRTDKGGWTQKTVSGQRPHYYTMYGVDSKGHEIAIADFKKHADARALTRELNDLVKISSMTVKLLKTLGL